MNLYIVRVTGWSQVFGNIFLCTESLNNPIYGENSLIRTFSKKFKRNQNAAAAVVTSDGPADNSLRRTDRSLDESNPLYALESGKSNRVGIDGASVKLDTSYDNSSYSLARVDPYHTVGVSSIDPYGSVPDESPMQKTAASGAATNGCVRQNMPQFDDSTYEIITSIPDCS